MGLDICVGWGEKEDEDLRRLVKRRLLEETGVEFHDTPDPRGGETPGRAYSVRALADWCREKGLESDFKCLSRIRCSYYELIVPVELPGPLPMFPRGSVEEYGCHARYASPNPRDSRYPYYMGTFAEEICLLPARTVAEECERFLSGRGKTCAVDNGGVKEPEDIDGWEDEEIGAYLLLYCCGKALVETQVVYYSG